MKIANLFREYLPGLEKKYKARLLPSHRRAIHAILTCRTPEAGTLLVKCPNCHRMEIRPSSCGHRNCPVCQNHETGEWLDRQIAKLLPVPYFLITFTIPACLRIVAWLFQRIFFGAMFEAVADALREQSRDERFLGGEPGFTAVLHTHSRRLGFHPHLHVIIPAGAIDLKNRFWKRKDWHFLFPEPALAGGFDKALLGRLREAKISLPLVPGKWVVNCREVGSGAPALKYLSRYLYRGVISEKQIVSNRDGKITFRFRDSETRKWRKRTLAGEDFLWLLLQHVLPRGFRRVRDFGFLHGNARKTLKLLQMLLRAKVPIRTQTPRPSYRCQACGANMKIVGRHERIPLSCGPP
jgi:hypothetical protein